MYNEIDSTQQCEKICTEIERHILQAKKRCAERGEYALMSISTKDASRYTKRYARKILCSAAENDVACVGNNIVKTCRLLLFAALQCNTEAFPDHFFLENASDESYRSAFAYYYEQNPSRAHLAAIIYHEYTRCFELNSPTLKEQVDFLDHAVNGNIERITKIVENLLDEPNDELVHDVYELLIRRGNAENIHETKDFNREWEVVEISMQMLRDPDKYSLFSQLCREKYPPPLAAIATYSDISVMPPAIRQMIQGNIDVEQAHAVIERAKAILTQVYCCAYGSLAKTNQSTGNFYAAQWQIEARELAEKTENLAKNLSTIDLCCRKYNAPEVAQYLRQLIESIPGFVRAYCSEAKPMCYAITMPLCDYINRNLANVHQGTRALSVIQELFPHQPQTDEEICTAWWAFGAVMACDDSREGDDFRDATTGAAAADFRKVARASTKPEAALQHYFSLRRKKLNHQPAIACLDLTYAEFGADMENSKKFLQQVRNDPELVQDHMVVNSYHAFHTAHQRLAAIGKVNINDPVLKVCLEEIKSLPYSLGVAESEAFPQERITDLQTVSSFCRGSYTAVVVHDLEQYNTVEHIVVGLGAKKSAFTDKVISNYRARVESKFRSPLPLFPLDRLSAVITIFDYVNQQNPGLEEQIQNYPPTYEARNALCALSATSPFVKNLITQYEAQIKRSFACAPDKPLFPASKVEEVVALWEKTEKVINSPEELTGPKAACMPWSDLATEYPFIAKILQKVNETEMYFRHLEDVEVVKTYVASLKGNITEKSIRDYVYVRGVIEKFMIYKTSKGRLGEVIRLFNHTVLSSFGDDSDPLFPLDLVEDVVVLWHYSQSVRNKPLSTETLAPPNCNLERLEQEKNRFPFINTLFIAINSVDLCRRHAEPWAILLGETRVTLSRSDSLPTIGLDESEKIMLAIVHGHVDRAAEEWLWEQRRKSNGLMPFGAKAHVCNPLDPRIIREFKARLRLTKTPGFKLIKHGDCLLFPPSTVVDFQLRFLTLLKLGVFDQNEGDLQFTCGGRLQAHQKETGFLATMMLLTTPVHVTYAPGAFHTTDATTGKRILLTEPRYSGVKITGLPFDLPQAHGRIDMLGQRDVTQSPFDWQLWSTLTVHAVFDGDPRFKKLYQIGQNELTKILNRHSLNGKTMADIISQTVWLHVPETPIVPYDVEAHEQMIAEVCELRRLAMQQQSFGIVGESRQLLQELTSTARIVQERIAQEKPEETARLLAGF